MDRSELSDENCDTSKCKLKMGASQAFVLKCQKRRKGLNHFGFEYLKKLFNSVNGKKILDKCERKMIEVYPQVAKGERKTIITSPPHFLYTIEFIAKKFDFIIDQHFIHFKLKDLTIYRSAFLKRDQNHSPNSHLKIRPLGQMLDWSSFLTTTGSALTQRTLWMSEMNPSKVPVLKPYVLIWIWGVILIPFEKTWPVFQCILGLMHTVL